MLGDPSDYPLASQPESPNVPSNARTGATSSPVRAPIPPKALQEVYDAVYLGMPPYEAMLLACLNDEQITRLDDDPEFNRHIRFYQQKKNLDLLRDVDASRQLNVRTGNSLEARWLLSKLDRKHFGNGPLEVGGSDELPPVSFAAKDI